MTPLERLAALKAAAVLKETTMGALAKSCEVSYNHFSLVVRGERIGSRGLETKIAEFIGRPVEDVFAPRRNGTAVGSA